MLTIHDGDRQGRRAFLKIGSLGLAGLTLPDLLALKARAADGNRGYVRDRSGQQAEQASAGIRLERGAHRFVPR